MSNCAAMCRGRSQGKEDIGDACEQEEISQRLALSLSDLHPVWKGWDGCRSGSTQPPAAPAQHSWKGLQNLSAPFSD